MMGAAEAEAAAVVVLEEPVAQRIRQRPLEEHHRGPEQIGNRKAPDEGRDDVHKGRKALHHVAPARYQHVEGNAARDDGKGRQAPVEVFFVSAESFHADLPFFNRLRAVSIVTAALPPVNRKNAAGRAL